MSVATVVGLGSPGPWSCQTMRFVAGYFRRHSVWKIPLRGWLGQLDRCRFRLFGYHTDVKQDAETAAFQVDLFLVIGTSAVVYPAAAHL